MAMNWLAILCAGLAYWVLGFVWYSLLFGNTWAEALRTYRAQWPTPARGEMAGKMIGTFVQTTFADHIFLTCPRGKETITIPQRPRQMEFHRQQVEGFLENIERGDANLCYRCQSVLEVNTQENTTTGVTHFTFTCVRCFSYGEWVGRPETAKIGKTE